MAIYFPSAPANYVHEMAYYWSIYIQIYRLIHRTRWQISTPNGPQRPLSFAPKRTINTNKKQQQQQQQQQE